MDVIWPTDPTLIPEVEALACATVVPPVGGVDDVICPTEPNSVPVDVPLACDTVVPPVGGCEEVMEPTDPTLMPALEAAAWETVVPSAGGAEEVMLATAPRDTPLVLNDVGCLLLLSFSAPLLPLLMMGMADADRLVRGLLFLGGGCWIWELRPPMVAEIAEGAPPDPPDVDQGLMEF